MVILFNPLSTTPGKQPLPLSLLALGAVLQNRHRWTLVDGNLERDPASRIRELARAERDIERTLLAVTVMPGPQLMQAVDVCQRVRADLPALPIVWGGYFPTQHAETILAAPYVDYVIRSQGEHALCDLVAAIEHGGDLSSIGSLSWKNGAGAAHNPLRPPAAPDSLPLLPYDKVEIGRYVHRTYLGHRTIAHSSSFGCPFACSFCAVVAMANRRWLAESPARLERILRHLRLAHGVDSVQMHDMDFFISEARTAEFAERVAGLGISWWGLGRVDTLMHYSDETWRAMQRSGLRMVFSGAESGSDETLERMNKGGKASASLTLQLARRMRDYGIVPEFSFVLGCPPDPMADMRRTFEFVREIKRANPATEIVMYVYTPVPLAGELYDDAKQLGFRFPQTLEEWASDRWRQLSMRRGDSIPWLESGVRRQVRNFERVLNAFYPTVTDLRLRGSYRLALRAMSGWRYRARVYGAPYELRVMQRVIR
ncbi:MAG: B12-binding domain-containing radical SAM protein, partial [Acidobacteria bacterium]|nr:B12-binding domain-containing radical SAM protein [Acidobacteriota bacterium]